jgi:hypothetical protein
MKDNWEQLFLKFGTGGSFTLPRLVSYSTKNLVTEADAEDVEAFFKAHSVEGAARTVSRLALRDCHIAENSTTCNVHICQGAPFLHCICRWPKALKPFERRPLSIKGRDRH